MPIANQNALPASYSAVVCAVGPHEKHVRASEVVFLSVCCAWFAVQYYDNDNDVYFITTSGIGKYR